MPLPPLKQTSTHTMHIGVHTGEGVVDDRSFVFEVQNGTDPVII